MSNLESEAASLGIPMTIKVDDDLRYSYCSAHMATLVSIEGKHARYAGECDNGHYYDVKRLVSELQAEYGKTMSVGADGKLTFGMNEGYQAGGLEEF